MAVDVSNVHLITDSTEQVSCHAAANKLAAVRKLREHLTAKKLKATVSRSSVRNQMNG